MTEEELLYEALRTPLGLAVRADPKRLRAARAKCVARDPAIHELVLLGPDASGLMFILRSDKARASSQ